MDANHSYTAFAGFARIATGDLRTVLSRVWESRGSGGREPVLVFDDQTGEQVDFDLRGTLEEVLARVFPPTPRKGPGRPSLGVACKEVCLLPRHWAWLERQPKRASGTIRRLVEAAQKSDSRGEQQRRAIEAAGRFMWSLTGNLEGFEEASRALYAGNWAAFDRCVASWPEDIREHLAAMLQPGRHTGERPDYS